MAIDFKRIITFNDRFRATLMRQDIVALPIKLKMYDSIADFAKPLLNSTVFDSKKKDVWQIVIWCPKCEKEQSIMFSYLATDEAMDMFVKKLGLQMEYFKKEFCGCQK
jgi:hypothetical protein